MSRTSPTSPHLSRPRPRPWASRWLVFAVLVSCLLAVGCGRKRARREAKQPEEPPLAFRADAAEQLQGVLDDTIAELGAPGAVMAVRRPNGAIWVGASGIAHSTDSALYLGRDGAGSVAGGEHAPCAVPCYSWQGCFPNPEETRWDGMPMHGAMRFRIASVTKTFTATLVLLLIEEDILSLDNTVQQWLGDIVPNAGVITIRHLLHMTSGLYDYAENDEFKRTEIQQPLRPWTPQQCIEFANEHGGTIFDPGAKWDYSNTDYVLLGMIVEKATNDDFARLVKARILEPLKLRDTSVPTDPEMPEPCAHGYTYVCDQAGRGWKDLTRQYGGWADGNMLSTAEDLLAWLAALLEGTLLGPELRDQMVAFVEVSPGVKYGLALFEIQGAVGHPGGAPGYTSAMFRYEEHDFVVLVNTDVLRDGKTVADHIFWRATRALLGEPSEPLL